MKKVFIWLWALIKFIGLCISCLCIGEERTVKKFLPAILILLTFMCCDKPNLNKRIIELKTNNSNHPTLDNEFVEFSYQGCQYIRVGVGNSRWGSHKGNCNNPIHALSNDLSYPLDSYRYYFISYNSSCYDGRMMYGNLTYRVGNRGYVIADSFEKDLRSYNKNLKKPIIVNIQEIKKSDYNQY